MCYHTLSLSYSNRNLHTSIKDEFQGASCMVDVGSEELDLLSVSAAADKLADWTDIRSLCNSDSLFPLWRQAASLWTWCSDPKSYRGGLGPLSNTVFLWARVNWHLIPSNGFSRVLECDRQHTDGHYGNICRNRLHKLCYTKFSGPSRKNAIACRMKLTSNLYKVEYFVCG